jgi:hypothetical protein
MNALLQANKTPTRDTIPEGSATKTTIMKMLRDMMPKSNVGPMPGGAMPATVLTLLNLNPFEPEF